MKINLFKSHKRCAVAIIMAALIFWVSLCAYIISEALDLHFYFGWKDVSIDRTVSFKIPESWESNEQDGLMYFYDKNSNSGNNIVLFQSKADECFSIGDAIEISDIKSEKNVCGENFIYVTCLSSTVNSLGTVYGEALVSVDGESQVADYIEFADDSVDFMFFSCERIDSGTLERIADSAECVNG